MVRAGHLIGAPLAGKIVITDDVITAGTAIRESFDIIKDSDAEVVAVIVALDPSGKRSKWCQCDSRNRTAVSDSSIGNCWIERSSQLCADKHGRTTAGINRIP